MKKCVARQHVSQEVGDFTSSGNVEQVCFVLYTSGGEERVACRCVVSKGQGMA